MTRLWMLIFMVCVINPAWGQRKKSELQLTLPPAIYAVTGVPISVYFDNIILSQSSTDYRFAVTSKIGQAEERRWTLTATAQDVGQHPLQIAVYDSNDKLLASQSTILKVAAADALVKQQSIRLLIIGDSLTHASAYPNEIARLLSQPDNPQWKMLGTHQPSPAAPGVAHEGYGGWTWARFVSHYEANSDGTHRKRSSPFVFLDTNANPKLDVQRYVQESCDSDPPDYVVIMLGINDCFSAPPDDLAAVDARIDVMFDHADRLLTAISDAAPNAQIGICLTTPPNARQEAFLANYKDQYTRWGWKRIQHQLVRRQMKYIAAQANPRINVVPTQLNLDPLNGYPANNAVHPNGDGYKQVGASVYSWLKWQLTTTQAETSVASSTGGEEIFLLPYFLGNGETGIYFAHSLDGLNFEWLHDGKVVMPAPDWPDNLTRDPSIILHDGVFHMVWTTSWNSRTIGYAFSRDLLTWSEPRQIDIWGDRTDVRNTWAPELHWDPEQKEFLLIWSSTTVAELNDGDGSNNANDNDHRTYASRTSDFETWSTPELFFAPQPEYSVIDPFLAHDDRGTKDTADDRWVMVIKNEMSVQQGGKNLRLTFSPRMQGPYDRKLGPPIVGAGTEIVDRMGEGPSLFKLNNTWHLYWDAPGSKFSYCLATSPDLETWTNRSAELTLPAKQMRHGTVLVVPRDDVKKALPSN